MNKIIIERLTLSLSARIGTFKLILEDKEVFKCFELANKNISKTSGDDGCLPAGVYKTGLRFSPKFSVKFQAFMDRKNKKCPLIVLYNEKIAYERYILIHHGNTDKDTLGCELIGYEKNSNSISKSRTATKDFYNLIYSKFGSESKKQLDLTCEIIDNLH